MYTTTTPYEQAAVKKNNTEAYRDKDGSCGTVFKPNQQFEVGDRVLPVAGEGRGGRGPAGVSYVGVRRPVKTVFTFIAF